MSYVGSEGVDQMLSMLLSNNMFIGGVLGCLLDNLIPGETDCLTSHAHTFL